MSQTDEAAIRALIENWARAVRNRDYAGILAYHAEDLLMFDLPPPLQSKGIAAYRETWDLFFSCTPAPVTFDIEHLDVVAGDDVAFATALMRCDESGSDGGRVRLDFRLTVGLRRIGGQWTVLHEHHSEPAKD